MEPGQTFGIKQCNDSGDSSCGEFNYRKLNTIEFSLQAIETNFKPDMTALDERLKTVSIFTIRSWKSVEKQILEV